jgi:hypothetical protein
MYLPLLIHYSHLLEVGVGRGRGHGAGVSQGEADQLVHDEAESKPKLSCGRRTRRVI